MPERVKAIVEYDGTRYHGWQIQTNQITIQEVLTDAVSRINGTPVILHAAGRTDAGVHARGQVIHCDVGRHYPPEKWMSAVNSLLPPDIRVMAVEHVSEEFHARLSAKAKLYAYQIWTGRTVSPFWYRYVHSVMPNFDWERVKQAANGFVGTHDFTPFTVSTCEVASRVRTVYSIHFNHLTDNVTAIEFFGNGFLRYMVRRMVGTLLDIGRHRLAADAIPAILAGIEGFPPGPTAPSRGLTLLRVDY